MFVLVLMITLLSNKALVSNKKFNSKDFQGCFVYKQFSSILHQITLKSIGVYGNEILHFLL